MSKKNKLKTRKAIHDCDVKREQDAEKRKAKKLTSTSQDANQKAKVEKSAMKRKRRDLLKKGVKYEDILKMEEQSQLKDMDVDP